MVDVVDAIVTEPVKSPSIIPKVPAPSRNRNNRDRTAPVEVVHDEVKPIVSEPVKAEQPTPRNNVELYYNIDDNTKQYSSKIGDYTSKKDVVINPIENPQNVLPQSNIGLIVPRNRNREEKVGIYYDIEDKTKQFSKPESNFGAEPSPVVPLSYSITLPSKDPRYESETTKYSYAINPDEIKPNVNKPSENRTGISNVDFGSLSGREPKVDEFGRRKISPQTYLDYKARKVITYLSEKTTPLILDTLFFNTQTRNVDTTSPAYKFLSKKVSVPSPVNTGKFLFFAPYMATGTQTYYDIFGNQVVKFSTKQAYLSPIERINIPSTTQALAGKRYETLGVEVKRKGEDLFINAATKQEVTGGKSLTLSTTRLTPTGDTSYAVFAKGVTTTDITGLSGTTFRTVNPFTFQGKIVNILPVGETTMLSGEATGFYYPSGSSNPLQIGQTKVLSQPAPSGKYTNVASLQKENVIFYDVLGKGRIYGSEFYRPTTEFRIIQSKPVTTPEIITYSESSNQASKLLFGKLSQAETKAVEGMAIEVIGQNAQPISVLTSKQAALNFPSVSESPQIYSVFIEPNIKQTEKIQETKDIFGLKSETTFKLKPIVEVIPKEETVQKSSSGSKNVEIFRTTQDNIISQAQEQSQSQSQTQAQRSALQSFRASVNIFRSAPSSTVTPNPRIIPPKLPLPKKSLFSKVKQAFKVVTYKGGKEEVIASGLPEGLAKKAGVKNVLSTLRASFKLKPSGETTIEDVPYNIPKGFRVSKVDKNRYVQLKNLRFGARSETKEAQFFRKQKKGAMGKWF